MSSRLGQYPAQAREVPGSQYSRGRRRIFPPIAAQPPRAPSEASGIVARPGPAGPPSNSPHHCLLGEERTDAAVSLELEHIWSRVQAQLALVVDEPTYRIWLEPLRAVELADERLVVEAPPHTCRGSAIASAAPPGRASSSCSGRARVVELVPGPTIGARARAHAGAIAPLAAQRASGTSRPRAAHAIPAARSTAPRVGTARQPQAHLRPVRHRRLQPARPRGRADGRRDARSGLQPAVHLRPSRRRQDPPAQLDRQPAALAQRRPDRPLHDRRGLHERVPRRARRRAHRRLQAPLPPRRRAARSTTSSSSSARPRPRRSSSTRSTPCTTTGGRSC